MDSKKNMPNRSKPRKKFLLDDLPYGVFNDLCRLLDGVNSWEELGGKHMKYNLLQLNEFSRGESSPSKTMLTHWGYYNGSIDQLFIHLINMGHMRAAGLIFPYVSPEKQKLFSNRPEYSFFWSDQTLGGNSSFLYPDMSSGLQQKKYSRSEYTKTTVVYESNSTAAIRNHQVRMPTEAGFSEFENKTPVCGKQLEPVVYSKCEIRENYDRSQLKQINERRENYNKSPLLKANESRENYNRSPLLKANESRENYNRSPFQKVNESRDKGQLPSVSCKENEQTETSRRSSIQSMSSLPQISFEEMQHSTNNFKSKVLGQGGFGTVYSGVWKNSRVAIKFIGKKKNPCIAPDDAKLQQSLTEIRALDSFRHKNIITLHGYSLNEDGLCLIYQLMDNGSLEDRLQCRKGTKPLTWMQRLHIILGSACGIQYLHTVFSGKPFIHGDIKSANILLDENFEPKLGDFGLSREGPPNERTHTYVKYINGSRAYLPLEYLTRNLLSTKVDTYGFGVVLFEVATGLRAYDELREKEKMSLALHVRYYQPSKWMNICDPKGGKEHRHLFYKFIELGYRCTEEKHKRPEMVKVYEEIESLSIAEKAKIKEEELLRSSLNTMPYEEPSLLPKTSSSDEENKYSEKSKPTSNWSLPLTENGEVPVLTSNTPSAVVSSKELKSEIATPSNNDIVDNCLPCITALGLGNT